MAGRPRRFSRFRRGFKSKKIPLSMIPSFAVPIGLMLGGNGGVHSGLINAFKSGDPSYIMKETANILPYETIGYKWDGTWDWGILGRNIGLIVGGMLVHKIATKFGANRYMSNIPIVGKYLSI
jgi:hypothetical protein